MNRILSGMAALLVFSSLVGNPIEALASRIGPEQNRTFLVNCDSKRARPGSIMRALDQARDGDTIVLRGSCTETLTIRKGITLDGRGKASLAPDAPTDRTITVMARDVTIRGLSLESPANFQVVAYGGAELTLESNVVRNANTFGIASNTGSFVLMFDNTVSDNTNGIIALSGSKLRLGVRFFNDTPRPNTIANNQVNGIAVIANSSAQILGGNTISGNTNGIAVVDGGQARIAGNLIEGNQIGIFSDSNATVQLPLANNPTPVLTALNSGVNVQLGIACRGGSIAGVPDGLEPAMRLPPNPATPGLLGGPRAELSTFCIDRTEPAPAAGGQGS